MLWRETIDRLRSRGVHNIVVAYSMADYADERQFAARYPCSPVSYTHLRAHETDQYLVCRLLLEKKKK